MSRILHGDESAVYRAVITMAYPEDGGYWAGHVSTEHVGPYATIGAAKTALTRAKRESTYGRARTVTGHVEKASLAWERVPE